MGKDPVLKKRWALALATSLWLPLAFFFVYMCVTPPNVSDDTGERMAGYYLIVIFSTVLLGLPNCVVVGLYLSHLGYDDIKNRAETILRERRKKWAEERVERNKVENRRRREILQKYWAKRIKKNGITPKQIMEEPNIEDRRDMAEGYDKLHGPCRFLLDMGCEKCQHDDYGELYRFKVADGSFGRDLYMVFVKVVNSTPEPDGTYREYFLRTAPTVTSAHEAVALSFGLEKHEYNPKMEA